MIATLLIWLYTVFLCYVYGSFFFKRTSTEPPAAPLIVITGLIVLTAFASYFSLFFQIGLLFNLLILAGAIGIILAGGINLPRIPRPLSWIPLILLCMTLLFLLENATHRPIHADTNLYYAQAIRWIESFPAVPGLGNLHGRLAFNSTWFISNAIFSLSFLGLGSFHLTTSVLFIAVIFYFWGGFGEMLSGTLRASTLLKIIFFPLTFSLLAGAVSSPGTDLPVNLLLWLMVVLWAEQKQPLLIVLLATFVFTIKLSSTPALILAVVVLGEQMLQKQKHRLAQYAIYGALMIFPFLVRNLILSGYLLYPFPSINLFSFDWQVPLERVNNERITIMMWARFPGYDLKEILAMPFSEWLPKWFLDQTLNRRLILLAALASPLLVLPGLRLTRRYWLGWLTCFAGSIFWLFSAPDFRFGQAFLLGMIVLALAPWLAVLLPRIKFSTSPKAANIVSGLVTVYLMLTFLSSFEAQTLASRLWLPEPYDQVSTQSCGLVNGSIFCAKAYGSCSYDAFPCAPSPRFWVKLRNPPNLRDGFSVEP